MTHSFFVPHGSCLLWLPGLIAMHATSDLTIALAYFAIPVLLGTLITSTEQRRIVRWFMAFITCCGLTHLVEIATIWWPVYYLQGYVKMATAAVSVGAVLELGRIVRRLKYVYDTQLTVQDREVITNVIACFQAERRGASGAA